MDTQSEDTICGKTAHSGARGAGAQHLQDSVLCQQQSKQLQRCLWRVLWGNHVRPENTET